MDVSIRDVSVLGESYQNCVVGLRMDLRELFLVG